MRLSETRFMLALLGLAVLLLIAGLALVVSDNPNSQVGLNQTAKIAAPATVQPSPSTTGTIGAVTATVLTSNRATIPAFMLTPSSDSGIVRGASGIKPRVTTKDRTAAAYTEQDAADYINNVWSKSFVYVDGAKPFVVQKVEFVTFAQIKQKGGFGSSLNALDDQLLCLVEFEGKMGTRPRLLIGTPRSLPTPSFEQPPQLIFHAQTGNLLVTM